MPDWQLRMTDWQAVIGLSIAAAATAADRLDAEAVLSPAACAHHGPAILATDIPCTSEFGVALLVLMTGLLSMAGDRHPVHI
jgi:hypothetical protein